VLFICTATCSREYFVETHRAAYRNGGCIYIRRAGLDTQSDRRDKSAPAKRKLAKRMIPVSFAAQLPPVSHIAPDRTMDLNQPGMEGDSNPAPAGLDPIPEVRLTTARIFQVLRRRWRDRIQPLNAFRGVYQNFREAELNAPRLKPVGYDRADSENWYLRNLRRVQFGDYPILYWLRGAFADSRSVLEIGGHMGEAYYGFSTVVQYPDDLRWTVMDVPSIAKAGADLARREGRTNIDFVSGLEDRRGADIVLSTGSLQYLETHLSDAIQQMRTWPKHLLINFIPVYDGPSFVTIQNIGTAYCAYRVFNREEFVDSLQALGYALVDSWKKPRAFDVPSHPERSFNHYTGFYFRYQQPAESTRPVP
jgi:putative methyltransferase (TIGR04325 family)